ncbi:hypothetical protein [Enterobacter phage 02_vB_Eclo_IJM]|nr:hypothetical protein [Enterobacter phage 02_vB_Eclo_IJM]
MATRGIPQQQHREHSRFQGPMGRSYRRRWVFRNVRHS